MFNIPRVKDRIKLTKDWKFYLSRTIDTMTEGTILIVEKIEEKKTQSRYGHISMIRLSIPKRGNKNNPHAGLKLDFNLSEVCDMEFEYLNDKIVGFKRDLIKALKDSAIDGYTFSTFIGKLDTLTNVDTFSIDILDICEDFYKKQYYYHSDEVNNLIATVKSYVRKHKIAMIED